MSTTPEIDDPSLALLVPVRALRNVAAAAASSAQTSWATASHTEGSEYAPRSMSPSSRSAFFGARGSRSGAQLRLVKPQPSPDEADELTPEPF